MHMLRKVLEIVSSRHLLTAASLVAILGLVASSAVAQNGTQDQTTMVASAKTAEAAKPVISPTYKAYRGVTIGMTVDEARQKLGRPKDKDKTQDLFVFSDKESAQVFYDDHHKVYAVSVDYMGKEGAAPKPADILGQNVDAKADGSMYVLQRYPNSGYWVAYSRTAGDSPVVTVTMQKLP